MQILAHGIDLVQFGRLQEMLDRHDRPMLDRIYTAREQADAGERKEPARNKYR